MQADVRERQYAKVGVALAAASVLAVALTAPRPPEIPIASPTIRLVSDAADSVLNIPLNLFYDIINIPYNEIQALNTAAGSLLFSGNWSVASATNIWGIDPGDPTHVAAIVSLLAPFPELSQGLQYQISGLLAAELPVDPSCVLECYPFAPVQPITGITQIDRIIYFSQALAGQPIPVDPDKPDELGQFGLFDHWFTVPLADLANGYTFDPDAPGSNDPAGPVYPEFGFGPGSGNPFIDPDSPFIGGTTDLDSDGIANAMPWAGHTFTLDLLKPFQEYYQSLIATPPDFQDAIDLPTLTGLARALQAFAAGLVVAYDPFVPGSPVCPEACALPDALTPQGIVQAIGNLWPGNPLISEWLTAVENGTANGPTDQQAQLFTDLLQTGVLTLKPDALAQVNDVLADINPWLPEIAADSGILDGFAPSALLADIQGLLSGASP
jgi:hypothetical protein